MIKTFKGEAKGKNLRIAVIASRFNEEVTGNLIEGAKRLLLEKGVSEKNIHLYLVPGAFEIPSVLEKLCRKNSKHKYDGMLAIGCVIKGETAHFEYISGLSKISVCAA